jgi:histidinol-phosphatase (PHP family)
VTGPSSVAPPVTPTVTQSRDLPLDAHLHTDLSPDSNVPIDAYGALAAQLGIGELAITDHVDFDRRDPAFDYAPFDVRERVVREAAERWAPHGVVIRFGAELTFNRSWESDLRAHLARHRYDFTIGSVHDWPDSPYVPTRVGTWSHGRPLGEVLAPYLAEVEAAARTGLFDTLGHLDVVKRYLHPHVPAATVSAAVELFEPVLRALVESGTALEINSSGLRHAAQETYPGPAMVVRYRELGGRHLTIGSDAHRTEWFAYRLREAYGRATRAGFDHLSFRRGGDRVWIPVPADNGDA